MPSETKGLKFLVRALGSRNFRLFFFGQAVSLIGTWMQLIAMRWLIYRLTKSELMLGVVGFVSDIPLFFLVPFAGVLGKPAPPAMRLGARQRAKSRERKIKEFATSDSRKS